MPNTDAPKPDDPTPDEPQCGKRADSDLARSYERIRSAGEELVRLDRLVSRMEGGGPPIPQRGTGPEPGGAAAGETPPSQKPSESKASHPRARWDQPMLLALAGFLLAICIFGAAFASRYGNEARAIKTAIMARWTAPVSIPHKEASEPSSPATIVQVAEAGEQPSPPAASSQKETKDAPSSTATPSADRTSAELAQSLETIAHDLASINEKLDQLKSSHEQTLREHADALQQLKTTQEQTARDNARMAAQIQALQARLATLSAKSSPAQILKRENDAAPRQRHPVAAAPRPPMRRAPPWRPRPYMDDPYYDDLYW